MNKINIFLIKLEIIFFITFNNSITKMFKQVKGENQIKYIEIKRSYTENKPKNHRYTTVDNYVNMIISSLIGNQVVDLINVQVI